MLLLCRRRPHFKLLLKVVIRERGRIGRRGGEKKRGEGEIIL